MTKFRVLYVLPLLAAVPLTLSGCETIGTIFKAGAWTGIVSVVVLLAIAFLVVSRFRRL